ncbi:hypothetical protein BJV74DRAFT_368699 [Russula compacta]|nr:hypothetical protein BJV74DRAFT_368699 [Russula compacta]
MAATLTKFMRTRQLTGNPCTVQNPRLSFGEPQGAVLPRRIAMGVFFVPPNGGNDKVKDHDNDGAAPTFDLTLPSTHMLANLEITHAVVERGSDLRLWCGMKALFVGPQDPLSKVVAWMRAVRRLGAHILVSDFAAAAGYLVVELGLTPRSAWMRIARGIPPAGDHMLARLYGLAIIHSEKEKERANVLARTGTGTGVLYGDPDGGRGCGYQGSGTLPRPCRNRRIKARGESGLKHVVVI